jgi:hypothetical protein
MGRGRRHSSDCKKEIARNSSDLSLFAWDMPFVSESQELFGIFALSPYHFKECGTLVPQENQFRILQDFAITNRGLSIYVSLVPCQMPKSKTASGLPLWCHRKENPSEVLVVPLTKTVFGYVRSHYGKLGVFISLCHGSQITYVEFLYNDLPIRDAKQILISRVLAPTAPSTIENTLKQFLSFELPRGTEWSCGYCSSITGFPPALWDDD